MRQMRLMHASACSSAFAPPHRDFRCGCKCLACCDWVAGDTSGNGTTSAGGTANDTLVYQCYQATDERPCSPYAKCQVRWLEGQTGLETSSQQCMQRLPSACSLAGCRSFLPTFFALPLPIPAVLQRL